MNTMTSTERAASIIYDLVEDRGFPGKVAAGALAAEVAAEALAAAGLLVTDEIQAVLDALTDDRSSFRYSEPINVPLAAAIRAYLASRAT